MQHARTRSPLKHSKHCLFPPLLPWQQWPSLQFPWWQAALLSSHRTAGLPWSLQPKRGMWRWWKSFWITARILSTETWWATPMNTNTNMECCKHFIQFQSLTFHIRCRQRISCYEASVCTSSWEECERRARAAAHSRTTIWSVITQTSTSHFNIVNSNLFSHMKNRITASITKMFENKCQGKKKKSSEMC